MGNILGVVSPHLLVNGMFRLWPRRDFILFKDQRLTRRQVLSQVKALAAGLASLGVKKGDRVVSLLPACPAAVCTLFLPAFLGTVNVPLNPLFGEIELRQILLHCGAKVVLTTSDWYGMRQAEVLRRNLPDLPELQHIIVLDQPTSWDQHIVAYSDVLAMGTQLPRPRLHSADPALLAYTSGATGQPKGVFFRRGQYWQVNPRAAWGWLKTGILRCLLLPFPLFHSAGMIGTVSAFLAGGKVILMDRLDPNQMVEFIQKEKVTHVGGSATMFRLLLTAAEGRKLDLSSVRKVTLTSEKLSPDLARSIHELFGCPIENFYGMTETMMVTSTGMKGDWKAASSSVGKPVPGASVKIVDEARLPLPLGQVGEIAVRSPQMMSGYYRNPELTAQLLDSEGWFYTGDAGMLDETGCLHLTGRVRDMINRAGDKIFPEDVEAFLETLPGVRRAAVVGVPNPLVGEDVVAFLEIARGADITIDVVRQHCQGRIAANKIPMDIRMIDHLPATPTGKLKRHSLRTLLLEEEEHA